MLEMAPFILSHIKIYPVFKPNEYFFKHYWDENSGEQKWEVYRRIVREEIMAKSFNFKLFELNNYHKNDFKKIMKGKEKFND